MNKFKFFLIILLLFLILILIHLNLKKKNLNNKKYDDIQNKNYNNFIKNESNINNIDEIIKTAYNYQHGSEEMTRNYKKSEKLYKLAIKQGSKDAIVYLANLYHDGSKNIKPNVEKSLYYYKLAVNNGYNDCLLDIGDIYLWGLDNVKRDQKQALMCYKLLQDKGSSEYRLIAEDRISQMRDFNNEDLNLNNENNILNRTGFIFNDISSNNNIENMFKNTISHPYLNDYNLYNNDKENDKTNLINIFKKIDKTYEQTKNYNDNILDTLPNNVEIPINLGINIERANTVNTNRIRNDHQNVHDHVVNKTVKKSVDNLKNTTNLYINIPKTLIDVRNLIKNSDCNNEKKEDAYKTLDTIETKNQKISSMNMSEIDALNLVWNRIHDPRNRSNEKNLKENLINELSECNQNFGIDNDKKGQVCSTGRFSRIVDTLNICDYDNAVKIVPKNVLNEELMNTASKIRNDMINAESDEVKKAIDALEPNSKQEELYKNFSENFKTKLSDTFDKEYVQKGIISKKILDNEVNKWINEI